MWSSAAAAQSASQVELEIPISGFDGRLLEIMAPNPGIGPLRDLFLLSATVAPSSEEIMHPSLTTLSVPLQYLILRSNYKVLRLIATCCGTRSEAYICKLVDTHFVHYILNFSVVVVAGRH